MIKRFFTYLLATIITLSIFGCSDKKEETKKETPKKKIVVEVKKKVPKITVAQKKKNFNDLLVPAVNKTYKKLDKQYNRIKKMIDNGKLNKRIARLKKEYKATSNQDLLVRLKPHPRSIALAQAATESAWATSRFFKDANNIFGVWSFNKNEPRIAAGETRGAKTIWVKKYASVDDAVEDYYKVLAKGRAYSKFRQEKMKENSIQEMVEKLTSYSERRGEYTKDIFNLIKYNKFYKHDNIPLRKKVKKIKKVIVVESNVTVENNITIENNDTLESNETIKIENNITVENNTTIENNFTIETNTTSIKDINQTQDINTTKEK